jgi:DNA-binding MarR family transcriptional regulator
MPVPVKVRQMARECIAVRVRLLNRLITGVCDTGLRPFGVRVAQVNILVVVAHDGPITPNEVARRLVMDKSTLSRDAEKLIANGWLNRTDGDDGRSHTLRITTEGLDLLDRIHPVWAAGQKKMAAILGVDTVGAVASTVNGLWAEMG